MIPPSRRAGVDATLSPHWLTTTDGDAEDESLGQPRLGH
jgi:hypothetical protein